MGGHRGEPVGEAAHPGPGTDFEEDAPCIHTGALPGARPALWRRLSNGHDLQDAEIDSIPRTAMDQSESASGGIDVEEAGLSAAVAAQEPNDSETLPASRQHVHALHAILERQPARAVNPISRAAGGVGINNEEAGPNAAVTVGSPNGSDTQPASQQHAHAVHANLEWERMPAAESVDITVETIEAALRGMTVIRIDGTQARLSLSYRRLGGELKHRCQLGTAPRCTGPSVDTAVEAMRVWFERFKGGLAPQTAATIGAHLDSWECRSHIDARGPLQGQPAAATVPPTLAARIDSQPINADSTPPARHRDWLGHLPKMDEVNPEKEWLHPVPTVARVPQELEAAVLDIFEGLWTAIADAVRACDDVAQTRAERLWHVLPKMLFAQPQRPR